MLMISNVKMLRTSAIIGLIFFVGLNVSLFSDWEMIAQLLGISWHLCLLIIVTLVAAPVWARAMGYAWLAINIVFAGATL